MAQATWDKDSPFLQLPGVCEDKLRDISKKLKDISFEKYVRMNEKERKALELFDDKQHDQVEKAIKVFPLVDVKMSAYVARENNVKDPIIRSGELMTIELDINLPNVPKGKKRGYIHSNEFPFMRRDNFVVMLTSADGNRILNYERVFIRENSHVWKTQMRTGEPMKIALICHFKNDAYKGLDFKGELFADVVPALPQGDQIEFKYSKKDLKEIAKKTILGQEVVMNEDYHDSDEELEDEYKHEAKQEESEEEDD